MWYESMRVRNLKKKRWRYRDNLKEILTASVGIYLISNKNNKLIVFFFLLSKYIGYNSSYIILKQKKKKERKNNWQENFIFSNFALYFINQVFLKVAFLSLRNTYFNVKNS